MLRLGRFSTGRGPGSRNLLKAVMDKKEQGELDIEISFVFCNWDNDEEDNPKREQRQIFFDMVKGYGIPLVTLSWKRFMPELWKEDQTAWRNEYGKELRRLTGQYPFDLCLCENSVGYRQSRGLQSDGFPGQPAYGRLFGGSDDQCRQVEFHDLAETQCLLLQP